MSRTPPLRGLLVHPPHEHELARLYFELRRIGAHSVGRDCPWPYSPSSDEELLGHAGEMLRYDPRLLSILLQLVLERWEAFNPLSLRRVMERMRWPQALLVVFDFAKVATDDPELRYFAEYLAAGHIRVEPAERFFLDAERPGSRGAARKLGRNLGPYARWGFVASERPTVDVHTKQTVGRYDAATRRRILDDLIGRRETLTLAEYLDAIDRSVSRQQARADLARHPRLDPVGHGRGARWARRE